MWFGTRELSVGIVMTSENDVGGSTVENRKFLKPNIYRLAIVVTEINRCRWQKIHLVIERIITTSRKIIGIYCPLNCSL